MKTLKDIQILFQDNLKNLYDEGEINSQFYLVIECVLGWSRSRIIIEINNLIDYSYISEIEYIIKKIVLGIPLQYALGETEFYGLKFSVNESVLIPRSETEELVDWILKSSKQNSRILDIGTGSGCIPISLKKNQKSFECLAIDVSEEALSTAKQNAENNECQVNFHLSNILSRDLSEFGEFDVIVSNPPYVLESEKELMHQNVLNHEPHLALFVEDSNPLLFYDRIAELAQESLKTGGFLFFEINEKYGQEVVNLLESLGFKNVMLRKDLNGKDRMIRCEKV